MNEINKQALVVKSQKLAGYLMMKGYKLHELRIDKYEPRRNVFIFTNCDQIFETMQEYKEKKFII